MQIHGGIFPCSNPACSRNKPFRQGESVSDKQKRFLDVRKAIRSASTNIVYINLRRLLLVIKGGRPYYVSSIVKFLPQYQSLVTEFGRINPSTSIIEFHPLDTDRSQLVLQSSISLDTKYPNRYKWHIKVVSDLQHSKPARM